MGTFCLVFPIHLILFQNQQSSLVSSQGEKSSLQLALALNVGTGCEVQTWFHDTGLAPRDFCNSGEATVSKIIYFPYVPEFTSSQCTKKGQVNAFNYFKHGADFNLVQL